MSQCNTAHRCFQSLILLLASECGGKKREERLSQKREHHQITLGLPFIPLFQQQKGKRRKKEREKEPKKNEG